VRIARACAAALAGLPVAAEAHLVSTGVGPFYDGMAHFFVSPEELLPVLAVALLAGLRGPPHARWAIAVLPLAWLAGASLGAGSPGAAPAPLVAVALSMIPGVLAAHDRRFPVWLGAALTALLGLVAGLTNGAAITEAGGWRAVAGAATTAFIVATLIAAVVVMLRAPWSRVAARAAGSWIAAVALLALGWALRA
jgi:hydrogenase/urease accessory protein HupE